MTVEKDIFHISISNNQSIFLWMLEICYPVFGFKGLAQALIHVYKSSIFNSKSVPFSSSSSKASRNSKMNRLLGFGKLLNKNAW